MPREGEPAFPASVFNHGEGNQTMENISPADNTEKEISYFLDGKITYIWVRGEIADITITPYQGSPALIRDTNIDSGNTGEITITVLTSQYSDTEIGQAVQIGNIVRHTDGTLITKEALAYSKQTQPSTSHNNPTA